jgi:transposase-like protein
MRRYEPEVRETMVQRMMSPENLCIATLARETGISRSTLHNWRKQAKATMGTPVPGNGKRPAAWSVPAQFF